MRDAGTSDAGTMMTTDAGAMMPEPGERSLSTDRDMFFGDSRCGVAGVKLCEDFEAGATGQAPDKGRWSVFGSTPTVDDARAARGKHSLHVHTDGNGASLIQEVVSFPATGNAFYGRMFVWFDSLPTAPQWAHWTIVAATGSGDSSEIRVGGQWDGSKNRWGVGTDHGPTGDWTNLDDDPHNAAVAPPTQQWVCVEWLYDGGSNELRFFMDGMEHPSLHATESDHGGEDVPFKLPAFDKLGLGWWLYQDNPTPDHYDVWIDEIALDDQRIGCVL
jgi:hypothetical protein